ncbi:MAG: hypothetical protein WBE13_09260, partial [Candidatus Acidiferrum sp.]
MQQSQATSGCLANPPCLPALCSTNERSGSFSFPSSGSRRILLGVATVSLVFVALAFSGCDEEPPPKPAAEAPAKPAAPAVPDEIQAAAQNLLGKETQVLVFGDLAKTGRQQFLAANVVPKNPKNPIPGTIVT